MDASLVVFTKEEQRSGIRIIWLGVSGAEIHRIISVQHRNNFLPRECVCELIGKFLNDRTTMRYEEETRCPITSTTFMNIQQVQEHVTSSSDYR